MKRTVKLTDEQIQEYTSRLDELRARRERISAKARIDIYPITREINKIENIVKRSIIAKNKSC